MPRFSSRSSSVSAYDDDIDAITPCPLPAPATTETSTPKPPTSLSSSTSYSSTTTSHTQTEEEPRQSRHSRRGSNSSSHHRRLLARVTGKSSCHSSRSPSPTTSCLSDAASEEDLDIFASRRQDSIRALEKGAGGDPERLWRRMLELQQTYGCYNSARMSAALESGDASLLRPSRACLNLLNENMVLLPDDADWDSNHNTATSPSKHH